MASSFSSTSAPFSCALLLERALSGRHAAHAEVAIPSSSSASSSSSSSSSSRQACSNGFSSELSALEGFGESAWREFVPFLLNFLREQACDAIDSSQASPRKTPGPTTWAGQRIPSDSSCHGQGFQEAPQSLVRCPISDSSSSCPQTPSTLEHPQRGARQSLSRTFNELSEVSSFGGSPLLPPASGRSRSARSPLPTAENGTACGAGNPPLDRRAGKGDVAHGARVGGTQPCAGPAGSAGERTPRSSQKPFVADFIIQGSERHAGRRAKQGSTASAGTSAQPGENGSTAAGALGKHCQSYPCQRTDASVSGDRGPRMNREQQPPHSWQNHKHRQGGTSLELQSRRGVGVGESSGRGELDRATAVRSPDANGAAKVPPNLYSLEEFPSMSAASSGNCRPSRRIKPTPVSVAHHRSQPNECFTSTPLSQPLPDRGTTTAAAAAAVPRDRVMSRRSPTWQSQLMDRHTQPCNAQIRAKLVSPDSDTGEPGNDSAVCSTASGLPASNHSGPDNAAPDTTSPTTPSTTSPVVPRRQLLDSPAGSASQTAADESPGVARPDGVSHRRQLDVLVELYSACLCHNLVPNLLLEVYFTLQLLTAAGGGTADVCKEEAIAINDDRGGYELLKAAYFQSVHNCVYFAVKVLEKLLGLLGCLDRSTLRSLLEHERVATFSPYLLEQLQAAYNSSTARIVTTPTSTILSVPFQPETDNRANFPSDRAFQNFKKQRDVFYALIRDWEDGRNLPGWEFERALGSKIRAMMVQLSSEENHSHFARLFQAQLIRMCKDPCETVPSRGVTTPLLGVLGGSDLSKLQRLQQRLTAPQAQGGPCPLPTFPTYQAFFRDFILVADSYPLCCHLMDGLTHRIKELNGECILAPDGDWDTCEQEWREHFKSVLLTARLLAKFLGFTAFLPYRTRHTLPAHPREAAPHLRAQSTQVLDMDCMLGEARGGHRLMLTLPWIVEFLSMMDWEAARMECYTRVFRSLLHIYRSLVLEPGKSCGLNRMLLLLLLGWLFQIPAFPEEVFFAELPLHMLEVPSGAGLDALPLVDQQLLFTCCPYVGELRRLLATPLGGGTGRNGGFIRKINPTAMEPAVAFSQRQTQTELEQAFFHNHPNFLKKTVQFVAERIYSNCIRSIRETLLVGLVEVGEARVAALAGFAPVHLTLQDVCTQLSSQGTAEAILAAQQFCATKAPKAMLHLLPEELSPQVVSTAADIAVRLAQEKATQWLNNNVDKILREALRSQVDGIMKSASYSSTNETSHNGPSVRACPATCSHANLMPSLALTQLKDMLCVTVDPSCERTVTQEAVLDLMRNIRDALQCKKYLSPTVERAFAQYTVELAAAVAFDRVLSKSLSASCWEESTQKLLEALHGVWSEFSLHPPFHLLLTNKNVSYLHTATDKKRCCRALLHLSQQLVEGRMHVGSELRAKWNTLLADIALEEEIRECLSETADKFKELCEEVSLAKTPKAMDATYNPLESAQEREAASFR